MLSKNIGYLRLFIVIFVFFVCAFLTPKSTWPFLFITYLLGVGQVVHIFVTIKENIESDEENKK